MAISAAISANVSASAKSENISKTQRNGGGENIINSSMAAAASATKIENGSK
jgi:hypothetical protein